MGVVFDSLLSLGMDIAKDKIKDALSEKRVREMLKSFLEQQIKNKREIKIKMKNQK